MTSDEKKAAAREAAARYRKTDGYKIFRKRYYAENRASNLARSKAWRENNRERYRELLRASAKTRTPETKARYAEVSKVWRLNNRERIRACQSRNYKAAYARQRPNVLKAYRYKYKNDPSFRARVDAKNKEWRANHPESTRRYTKNWGAKNPIKLRAYAFTANRKRKHIIKLRTINPKAITKYVASIKSRSTAPCYYCGEITPISKIQFDHIFPLSRGGDHSVGNLCVACENCNRKKHNTLVRDWKRSGQQLLGI